MKTTTWPRIDIEKETELIIGLFYTRSLFFVCSIYDLYSIIVLYLFPFAICEIFIYIELNHCYSNCLPNICMYASI